MSGFVGLEAFFSSVEVQSKSDVIVAAIHWALILAGFRCVGIDNEAKITPTELLPKKWNQNQELYTLKYVRGDDTNVVHTLKVVKVDNTLLVNILNSSNDSVKAASINVDGHVNDDFASFGGAYKDPKALHDIISSNLIQQAQPTNPTSDKSAEDNRQRDRRSEDEGPSSSLPDYFDPSSVAAPRRDYDDDPLSVGRGDLDPLGRNTAEGMFMDPNRLFRPFRQAGPRYGLPRGAIPPGARFDPFGPPIFDRPRPDRNRFGVPDPDHLPPPGYDDMFG